MPAALHERLNGIIGLHPCSSPAMRRNGAQAAVRRPIRWWRGSAPDAAGVLRAALCRGRARAGCSSRCRYFPPDVSFSNGPTSWR